MRRVLIGLGGGVLALAIAGAGIALWTRGIPLSEPPAQTAPPQTSAPPTPGPAAAAPNSAPGQPSFDIVKVDPSGHAVIAGRAAPGAKVQVLDGDKSLGEVTADDRGEWVLVPTAPIAPGERRLNLQATDPATGAQTKSADTVALAVGPPAQSTPGNVAVRLPGNPNEPAQTLQTPGTRSGSLSLDTAENNDKGELMLSGHASPGATVRLYADNQPLATVTADSHGNWSSVSPLPKTGTQPQAKIDLRADELGPGGTVAQRVAESFDPAAAQASTGRYTVHSGNSLWVIARKNYGNGLHYTVIFGANKDHIRDPNLIYPGQVISLPKS